MLSRKVPAKVRPILPHRALHHICPTESGEARLYDNVPCGYAISGPNPRCTRLCTKHPAQSATPNLSYPAPPHLGILGVCGGCGIHMRMSGLDRQSRLFNRDPLTSVSLTLSVEWQTSRLAGREVLSGHHSTVINQRCASMDLRIPISSLEVTSDLEHNGWRRLNH